MLPMKILALDTALTGCGVCVYDADTGDAQTMRREMGRGQVEHLIPMAQQAMDKAGVAFADRRNILRLIKTLKINALLLF